jgi:hypothetical protein
MSLSLSPVSSTENIRLSQEEEEEEQYLDGSQRGILTPPRSFDPRAIEQRAMEQRVLEQRAMEQRVLEQRAMEQRVLEQRNIEERGISFPIPMSSNPNSMISSSFPVSPPSLPSNLRRPPLSSFADLQQMQPAIKQTTPARSFAQGLKNLVGMSPSANNNNSTGNNHPTSPRKTRYTYYDVEDAIGPSRDRSVAGGAGNNALDILALYIKGQKLLYTEAKTYCEQQLNFLMLPAIFISCVGSIFSFMADRFVEGSLIMASMNGFNAFLLAVISYLKLDAKAQAHKTSAYKFDKLESMCEFSSGKFLFFENSDTQIMDVVSSIEKEVKEIKETNQFILPETIRYEFTDTYSTNVFLMVKKLQHTESTETQNLAFALRMLRDLYEELNITVNAAEREVILDRINMKEITRDNHIYAILSCREKYFRMDEAFNAEIERHIARSNRWFISRLIFCDWLKS